MFAAPCYNNCSCVPMSKDVIVYPDWGMVINPLMILMYILICTDDMYWWWFTPSEKIPIDYGIDHHELCTTLFEHTYGATIQEMDGLWEILSTAGSLMILVPRESSGAWSKSSTMKGARAAFLRSSQQFSWSCLVQLGKHIIMWGKPDKQQKHWRCAGETGSN